MKHYIIVAQFETEDDFGTDPFGYYIELDGRPIKKFGDDYHDNGLAKCEAYLDALKDVLKEEIHVTFEERADFEW